MTHPVRVGAGVAAGALTAVGDLAFLLAAAVAAAGSVLVPPARRRVGALIPRYATTLVRLERRRLAELLGANELPPIRTAGRRDVTYLAARLLPGALGALAYLLLAIARCSPGSCCPPPCAVTCRWRSSYCRSSSARCC
ncbi:hypothetical protein [Micromonospora avicenniae]|uniref:hypothetical protein n=1 Tax=Micromonospora avicenniae TaxID=1198245 RepID=UPI003426592A